MIAIIFFTLPSTQPIELREDVPEKACKIDCLGLWSDDAVSECSLLIILTQTTCVTTVCGATHV